MKLSTTGFMKFWLGALLLCVAQFVMAQVGTVYELQGTAQAQAGTGAPRMLRKGDSFNQGETISSGAASYVLLRFSDNQIVTLTPNSRMKVDTYVYDRADAAKSNVLFSLLEGGMRAITGAIGKARPQQVSYRAANATIGIRGTDVQIHTTMGDVAVLVHDGLITFTIGNQTATISAGSGGRVVNGMVVSAPMATIISALLMSGTASARAIALDLSMVLPTTFLTAMTTALQNPTNTQTDTKADTKKNDTSTTTTGKGTTPSNK